MPCVPITMSLLYRIYFSIMSLPTWNQLMDYQKNIEEQHKELMKLFPEMVWKFYTTECVKDSALDEQIQNFRTLKKWLIHTEETPWWTPFSLGGFIYWTWDISDPKTYNTYMSMHVQDVPSRALAFTPNWYWRSYHKTWGRTTLSLSKETAKWMFCVPLDIDKKDYDKVWYPLPDSLKDYKYWKDVDPLEFVYRWFDNTRDLKPDAFEWINEYFYKNIINNISWINITPGWFHAYIMLNPKEVEDPFFKNMTSDEYNFYMKWFHKIAWSDLMFDASRVNLTDVMRLPCSLHRKFKKEPKDYWNSYICIPCPIKSINYTDTEEDWSLREHVVELWKPFSVSADTIKYADEWRVKLIFKQIKNWIEDPDFLKKIDWYRNTNYKSNYIKSRWSRLLSISEKEIWRCCMYHWLNRWKVIDNLPWWYVSFDTTYWALKFRQPNWMLEHTSWYKFKSLPLISEDEISKMSAGNISYTVWWIETNYCWWYVNDWFSKHDRPAWPMINFVFMYMQQFVCPRGTLIWDIYEEVKNYFKKICPEIDATLLSNGSKVSPENKIYWKPSCYIECYPDRVMCKYTKQTATWKDVDTWSWFLVFDRPVNFIWRMMMVREWPKFISNNEEESISTYKINNEWVYTRDVEEYTVKYLMEVNHKTIALTACSYANMFERQLVKNNVWLHFLWWDETCKRFFNALDLACDESLPTHKEYWLRTIRWNQWSKYWINKETGNPYCVIWDTAICWDCPEILEPVDETAKDIMDWNLPNVSVEEYWSHIKKLWEPKVYEKIFISSWSCQFMNIVEDVMKANLWITLWPNVNIYWWSETGKSSLRYAIQSSFWYKSWKKYLSMQMTTPQPLIDSMLDWACMLYEEMTSKVESDQKKQEAKEIVIRWAANKETKMTGWLQAKKAVKMRSCNIYFWESSIKDDSANNRIIKIKLVKGIRNPNKDEGEAELRWLQNHTIRDVLYSSIMSLYSNENELFEKLIYYKKLISKKMKNERLWDLECYWAVLFVDVFKLWTFDYFMDMIEYNVENDVSNVKDITLQDPLNSIESLVHWLLFKAESEKSYITFGRFDTFPDDKYNNYWADNYTAVVKIDLSTIKTNITNFDNDVEKINELVTWFVKTIWQSIYIISYWNEFINRARMLVDEWFLEWFDIEKFVNVNKSIRDTINLMCFGKQYQNWYSLEKANQWTVCTDVYWSAIKKVIFTSWIML